MNLIVDYPKRYSVRARRRESNPTQPARTTRHRSRLCGIAIGLTSTLLTSVIGPAPANAQPEPASCTEAPIDRSLDIRRITIGSETFDVPASHFDIVPPNEHENDSVLLFLSWPALTWNSRDEMLATLLNAGSEERINLLISQNLQHEGALRRVFESLTTRFGPPYLEPAGRYHGLNRYLQLQGQRTLRTQEIYVWPNSNDILILIRCIPADASTYSSIINPACVHSFYVGELSFRLTYQRSLLTNWDTIHSSVSALLNCYEVDQPSSAPNPELEE